MKHYEVLLFDVDQTLLDFDRAEQDGIRYVLTHYGLPATEDMVESYHILNKSYWERLERGELTRDQVLTLRFEEFLGKFGIRVDGAEVDALYREKIDESAILLDGAMDLIRSLKDTYALYIVTNGVTATQHKRLVACGLDRLFLDVFISEEADAQKPEKGFFEYCFRKMGRWDTEKMLIIGDSLTSDIRGGNNAGIDTLWFNPNHQVNTAGVHVDYEADSLRKIGRMLS